MDIRENLEQVQSNIATAAAKARRKPEDVELVAVSKTFPVETIREAVDAGQLLFGENKVQELLRKTPDLPAKLRWHLIGHLQSNKVRKVLPVVEMIQSVDSIELAYDINRIAGELGVFPKILLEVNVAEEASKHGFPAHKLETQLEDLLQCDRIEIHGLMCIPPISEEPEDSRKYFVFLREYRDKLEKLAGTKFPTLSMGMSGDYAVAVEEGATFVRVGSAIFGRR
jgi:pyridoxal phosphate enzyme (YggS family)